MSDFAAGALSVVVLQLIIMGLILALDDHSSVPEDRGSVHYHWHWHAPRQQPPQIEQPPPPQRIVIVEPPTTALARRNDKAPTDMRRYAKIERVNL